MPYSMDIEAGLRWLVGSAIGLLVFMIGVSVLFESLALGLVLLWGSLLVLPGPRRLLQSEFDVNCLGVKPRGIRLDIL